MRVKVPVELIEVNTGWFAPLSDLWEDRRKKRLGQGSGLGPSRGVWAVKNSLRAANGKDRVDLIEYY